MLPNTTVPNDATLYEDRDRYAENRTASLYYNNASAIAGNKDKTDNFVEGLFIDKLAEQKEFINQLMYLVDQRQRLFKRNVGALESAISRTYNLFPSSQSGVRYTSVRQLARGKMGIFSIKRSPNNDTKYSDVRNPCNCSIGRTSVFLHFALIFV